MSLSQVKWTIPHVRQNCVKNTTLYIQGQCLFLSHQLFQANCLLPSFGRLSKSVLTTCDNYLEVRWTIPHLLRQEVDYRYVKVGLWQLRLRQTTFLIRGEVGFPTFSFFFFFFFSIRFYTPVICSEIIFQMISSNLHVDPYAYNSCLCEKGFPILVLLFCLQ